MNTLLAILAYIPGAIELLVFSVALGVMVARKRRLEWRMVSLALITMGIVCASIYLGVGVFGSQHYPLLYLTQLGIAAIGFISLRTPAVQPLAMPTVILFYLFSAWQFGEVQRLFDVPANWKIGERGKKENGLPELEQVEFQFGRTGDSYHTHGVYSDGLAGYLKSKAGNEATLTLRLSYRWGALSGTSLRAVDGKPFPWEGGGYAGTVGKDRPVFPQYYWLPRALSHVD